MQVLNYAEHTLASGPNIFFLMHMYTIVKTCGGAGLLKAQKAFCGGWREKWRFRAQWEAFSEGVPGGLQLCGGGIYLGRLDEPV